MNLEDTPHRRYSPLTGEWILVSPHRTKRPWNGKIEALPATVMPKHDPSCNLCPGNPRAGGQINPDYHEPFVFANDFAALLPDTAQDSFNEADLLRAEAESGACKVICFSPRHDLTLARMSLPEVSSVVDTWKREYELLAVNKDINYVQIFENRGEVMGCSNPHPHGQIWSNRSIPDIPAKEGECQNAWLAKRGTSLLLDYLDLERSKAERLIFENEAWTALVPFWAVWPYETMIVPRFKISNLSQLEPKQADLLADALGRMTRRFDQLFQTSFPYSMGIHQSPCDGKDHPEWQLHIHFLPPLLRSATVKKFMVGYEMLAMPQRDITAEMSAAKLRSVSEEVLA